MARKKITPKPAVDSKAKKKRDARLKINALKKTKKTKASFFKCKQCLGYIKVELKKSHFCEKPTELNLIKVLNEDGKEAWEAIKRLCTSFGTQKIYASAKAIMFSRRVCFCFVRPKPTGLEMIFFLNQKLSDPLIKRTQAYSKTKYAHTLKIVHADQIDHPLTDWLRQAWELAI